MEMLKNYLRLDFLSDISVYFERLLIYHQSSRTFIIYPISVESSAGHL